MTVGRGRMRAVVLLLCATFVTWHALAKNQPVGVNRPAIAWMKSEAEAEAVVDAMAREKVPAVRIMLVPPFDRVARLARRANRAGMEVLLMVPLTLPAYFPPGTTVRPPKPDFYSVPPLSMLDVARFTAQWELAMKALADENVRVGGLQIENEFNSSVFNADLPAVESGYYVDESSAAQREFWAHYLAGMKKLAEVSAMIAESARRSAPTREATIVLGGLARPQAGWIRNTGVIIVEPALALRVLRDLGIDRSVDAYAIHLYPLVPHADWPRPKDHIARYVEGRMAPVAAAADPAKPWWVTEFGFAMRATASAGCDAGDERKPLYRAFVDVLSGSRWAERVHRLFVYDWDESTRFRIIAPDGTLCVRSLFAP